MRAAGGESNGGGATDEVEVVNDRRAHEPMPSHKHHDMRRVVLQSRANLLDRIRPMAQDNYLSVAPLQPDVVTTQAPSNFSAKGMLPCILEIAWFSKPAIGAEHYHTSCSDGE